MAFGDLLADTPALPHLAYLQNPSGTLTQLGSFIPAKPYYQVTPPSSTTSSRGSVAITCLKKNIPHVVQFGPSHFK